MVNYLNTKSYKLYKCITVSLLLMLLCIGCSKPVNNSKSSESHEAKTDAIVFCYTLMTELTKDKSAKIPYQNILFMLKDQLDFESTTVFLEDGSDMSLKGADNFYWKLDDSGKIILSDKSQGKDIPGVLFIQAKSKSSELPVKGVYSLIMVDNLVKKYMSDDNKSIKAQKLFELVGMKSAKGYDFTAPDVNHTSIFHKDLDKAYIEYDPALGSLTAKFDKLEKYIGKEETQGLIAIQGMTDKDYFYNELIKN